MYRRVLPLLLAAALLLSGCAAAHKNMPQKTESKEMAGHPSDTVSYTHLGIKSGFVIEMTIIALFHFSLLKYWFCRLNILKNAFPYYCFS